MTFNITITKMGTDVYWLIEVWERGELLGAAIQPTREDALAVVARCIDLRWKPAVGGA